jgi:hypothetical protein
LDILQAGAKLRSDHFCKNVIELLERVVCPNDRKAGTIRHVLHFDNVPVHNAERVQRKLEGCSFRPLERQPYSLDLAPLDFFLFGYLHEKMQFLLYETVEELEQIITATIENVTKSQLIQVFRAWRRRLKKCIQHEGNYFQEIISRGLNIF